MKRIVLSTLGLVLLSAPSVFAQEFPAPGDRAPFDPFLQNPAAEVRAATSGRSGYATRQELVFRKAALRAAQRQDRIALNKALGYSPLRPPSSTVPAMGSPIGRPVIVWRSAGTLYPPRFAY